MAHQPSTANGTEEEGGCDSGLNGCGKEFPAVPLLVFPGKLKQLFLLKVQGAPTTKVCSILIVGAPLPLLFEVTETRGKHQPLDLY